MTRFVGRRRGVRHQPRIVRRVRRGPGGQARDQAAHPDLRTGRSRPRLRAHRAAGDPRCRTPAGRSAGAGHRRLRWSRQLRRPDRQGPGRAGHRRREHRQARPRACPGRRPRHRLHRRRLRRRYAPLRPHPRHRWQLDHHPSAPSPHPQWHARHRRRRERRQHHRWHEPAAPCGRHLAVPPPTARHAHHQGASHAISCRSPSSSRPAGSFPAWSGPSRWSRCPTPCVSSHPARCAARWPSPSDAECRVTRWAVRSRH